MNQVQEGNVDGVDRDLPGWGMSLSVFGLPQKSGMGRWQSKVLLS